MHADLVGCHAVGLPATAHLVPGACNPDVEAVLAEGDAQTAALKADVWARRQVRRRTHGAPFSESLGIVALARAGRGQ